MKNNILKFILSVCLLGVILSVLVPYFNSSFLEIREQKEAEENQQKLLEETKAQREAEEKTKKELESKNYLMGKFDPARREDFILIPKEHTTGSVRESKIYLRKETYHAYLQMMNTAALEGIDLKIASATRNFNYQKSLWEKKWKGTTLVEGQKLPESFPDGLERFEKILEYSAAPGTSRHHWGTDIDLSNANPEYFETQKGKREYEWLARNALLFGFCQTYIEKEAESEVGYNEEKWHWSYLPLARNFTVQYKELITDEDIIGFLGDKYSKELNLIDNFVLGINPACI